MDGLWGERDSPECCDKVREIQLDLLLNQSTEEDGGSTFDLDEIRKCLKGAPARAALGADQWRPHEWRNLPDEGLAELRQVLTGVERCVAWPRQVLHNVAVFIGKPTTPPTERSITLTAGLCRL